MAKNFKSYVRENKGNNNKSTSGGNNAKGQTGGVSEEEIRSSVNNYSRMNENQLMNEMMKIAGEEKAKGTLGEGELRKFYNQVSPMLSEAQRNKLKALINTLK